MKSVFFRGRFLICLILGLVGWVAGQCVGQEGNASSQESAREETADEDLLKSLGVNSNRELGEISGSSLCSFDENSIWTHNDSGNSSHLFLLRTDGKVLAKVKLEKAKNVDWESMCRFKIQDKSYLMIGDVGDNLARRKKCQLYLIEEPDLSKQLAKNKKGIVEAKVTATRFEFSYPDGARNCEAIAVDVLSNQVWLIEKIYVDNRTKTPPGIYVLPLHLKPTDKPLVAKRFGDFRPRNVTGMNFSPDGQRLIIRNYLNAHLYSRVDDESWETVIKTTNPSVVVLPLQRQGESVCFTHDSQALIITTEKIRQPIWRVDLKSNFQQPRRMKNTKPKTTEVKK